MEQIFYHNSKKRAYDDSFLPEKPSLTKRENYGTMGLRGCGGTGRHKGLKIPRSKIRTGSIPGSEGSAAGGGKSDPSEWQRSTGDEDFLKSRTTVGHRNRTAAPRTAGP